jgi:hypothetical protein
MGSALNRCSFFVQPVNPNNCVGRSPHIQETHTIPLMELGIGGLLENRGKPEVKVGEDVRGEVEGCMLIFGYYHCLL